jgi:hypothetical protein
LIELAVAVPVSVEVELELSVNVPVNAPLAETVPLKESVSIWPEWVTVIVPEKAPLGLGLRVSLLLGGVSGERGIGWVGAGDRRQVGARAASLLVGLQPPPRGRGIRVQGGDVRGHFRLDRGVRLGDQRLAGGCRSMSQSNARAGQRVDVFGDVDRNLLLIGLERLEKGCVGLGQPLEIGLNRIGIGVDGRLQALEVGGSGGAPEGEQQEKSANL